eukprot:97330-Rhodomonas_salina.1
MGDDVWIGYASRADFESVMRHRNQVDEELVTVTFTPFSTGSRAANNDMRKIFPRLAGGPRMVSELPEVRAFVTAGEEIASRGACSAGALGTLRQRKAQRFGCIRWTG